MPRHDAFWLEPGADRQLDEIYDYTAERWGEDQADRYVEGLFGRFAEIAGRGIVWRKLRAALGISGYRCRWGSHVIYWRQRLDGDVAIFAILRERMHQSPRLRDALNDL